MALMLFLSCSKHPLFLKKRYSHGYRLLSGKNELKNKKITCEANTSCELSKAEIHSNLNAPSDEILSAVNSENTNKTIMDYFTAKKHDVFQNYASNSTQDLNSGTFKTVARLHIEKKHNNSNALFHQNKKNDSDTELIILVILSLFPILSLIAVYLKDGKKITVNFWVTLILHFIFLYWLFALLRVLDVINLA